jgi:hypothetical protein
VDVQLTAADVMMEMRLAGIFVERNRLLQGESAICGGLAFEMDTRCPAGLKTQPAKLIIYVVRIKNAEMDN